MVYSVTLTDDRVIAWNIKKKIRKIKYDEIEKIIKHEKNNAIVLATAGHTLELSADIEYYGSCIEAIRARSDNVTIVDYGGLDKKDNIWRKII